MKAHKALLTRQGGGASHERKSISAEDGGDGAAAAAAAAAAASSAAAALGRGESLAVIQNVPGHGPLSIKITFESKPLIVECANKDEKEAWLIAFRKAIPEPMQCSVQDPAAGCREEKDPKSEPSTAPPIPPKPRMGLGHVEKMRLHRGDSAPRLLPRPGSFERLLQHNITIEDPKMSTTGEGIIDQWVTEDS